MRKTFFTLLFVFALLPAGLQAQIQTPAASPFATMTQMVGLTEVKLEYSRPNMRGREIFGALVPFDKIWRTGANQTTKFMIDKPIMISGQKLDPGTYSIYTVPGQDTWEVVFYTDDSNPLINEFDESKIALRTMVDSESMPMEMETFTILIDNISAEGAVLNMLWADTVIMVPFEVMTDQEVTASIEQAMAGPSAGDYYNAAVYYLNSGKDIDKAKSWMNSAMSKIKDAGRDPGFWQLRQQSLIYAKAGDKKEAIATAKKSLDGAIKAGNADYIKMNEDSLKEWGAM
ncbi:MAG: DUF2911 domain-containing protein [Leeuwenhoekiella sp.]